MHFYIHYITCKKKKIYVLPIYIPEDPGQNITALTVELYWNTFVDIRVPVGVTENNSDVSFPQAVTIFISGSAHTKLKII